MTSRLQLRQLEALNAVAETGTISKAAKVLDISQPAASRLLSDLAKNLNIQLYHRRDGALVLTQEARYLLPEIRRLLESIENISQIGRSLPNAMAGHLRIACLPGFAISHLPAVVAEFVAGRPNLTVTIEPDRPERILEWILGEQYDFGITDGFGGHPAVESTSIDMPSVCVFPVGHRFEGRQQVTPWDFQGERLIHDKLDDSYFRSVRDAFLKAGANLRPFIETRQFTCACELVCLGAGVSIVSILDAKTYKARGLSYCPFVPNIPHKLSLVRPKHRPASLVTLEFMEQFEESLAQIW